MLFVETAFYTIRYWQVQLKGMKGHCGDNYFKPSGQIFILTGSEICVYIIFQTIRRNSMNIPPPPHTHTVQLHGAQSLKVKTHYRVNVNIITLKRILQCLYWHKADGCASLFLIIRRLNRQKFLFN